MEDLRNKRSKENIKIRIFFLKLLIIIDNIFLWIKKNKWKLLFIFLIFTLIKPVIVGTFIGKWITYFVGSIIKNIHLI
jgi:hypothetical protein